MNSEQSMEHQNTVKEALNALYHHPDDAVRMQADRWLQNFQRTLDAWQVADNLLHDATSNLETLIFCSQTLRSKVQRDFEELPPGAFHKLRDSLNALLKKFHRGPPKVRTQISIAVAALAVHVPAEDWGDGGIVSWLSNEMNSHGEYIPGFLELLTVLPEEVFNYKIAARPDRRRQFEKELTSQTEVALNILTACLNFNGLKEQVLEAFASWLRLRHGIGACGVIRRQTTPEKLTAGAVLCGCARLKQVCGGCAWLTQVREGAMEVVWACPGTVGCGREVAGYATEHNRAGGQEQNRKQRIRCTVMGVKQSAGWTKNRGETEHQLELKQRRKMAGQLKQSPQNRATVAENRSYKTECIPAP